MSDLMRAPSPQHRRVRGDDGLPPSGDPPPFDPVSYLLSADDSSDMEQTITMPVVTPVTELPDFWTAGPALAPDPVRSSAQVLTCPECGTTADVTVSRRESGDFCRKCDYPLFWIPSRIELDRTSGQSDESLRRLPGTVGRATIASLACPHCAEPNAVSAETCIRCGLAMHLAPPPPPAPEPVYYAPPEPVTEVEKRGLPWWVWALIFIGLTVVAAVVTIGVLQTLN